MSKIDRAFNRIGSMFLVLCVLVILSVLVLGLPVIGCETYTGTVTDIEQTANAAMTRIWRVTVEYKEPGRLHPMKVAFEMTDAEWYAVNLTIGSELEIVRKFEVAGRNWYALDHKRCPVEQGQ